MEARCLILDQDVVHARMLVAIAGELGFAATVGDLDEAGSYQSLTQYDLVFVDLPEGREDQVMSLMEAGLEEGTEVFAMSETDTPEAADNAIRRGASYFFCKPAQTENLRHLLEDIATEAISTAPSQGDQDAASIDQFGMLRGSCRAMRKLYRQIRKVAQTDVSVIVVGESGTGKELVSHTMHLLSSRRDGPYMAFNCAAMPESLTESELFGHEKGAFSGATHRHLGHFERASGGTLLLDEITEMDIDLQAKLLRVLETRKLRRLGSEQDIEVDVRVVSACNRPPDQAVQDGLLREDLYYRLAQFPLRLPPLRRRGEDVFGLAQFFLRELNQRHNTGLTLSDDIKDTLASYAWPGNVRELKSLVERAYIMSESLIDAEFIQAIGEQANAAEAGDQEGVRVSIGTSIAEMERKLILATLRHTGGDRSAAADMLGISVKTLYNRLKDYAETS